MATIDKEKKNCSCMRGGTIALSIISVIVLGAVVSFAILRDRIVNQPQWQVQVTGQGKVAYQPDTALISLGVQVDRAATAEAALGTLSDTMKKVSAALLATGVPPEDIQTQNFTVYAQYDFIDNTNKLAGYNANQQVIVKVRDIAEKSDLVSKVIADASKAGANQVNGITYDVSNLNDIRQEARLAAIKDAQSRAGEIAATAGVKLGEVVGWWENMIAAPSLSPMYAGGGYGGGSASPVTPNGNQELIMEVSVSYRLK